MMVDFFDVCKIAENPEYSALVPEMSDVEWEEFKDNVKKYGIRQPITVNKDLIILDGRHRVRACKELGIQKIAAIVNEMTDQQAIEFVRDTAIERRNLTKEKKIDIALKSEELMEELQNDAKKRQLEALEKRHKQNLSRSSSTEDNRDKKGRTDKKIADLVGAGESTVTRMRKVKKEDPDLYEKVLTGEKTPSGAYFELKSIPESSKNRYKKETKTLTKEEAKKKVVTPMPDFEKSDKEMQQEADYENLKNHLSQTLATKVFIEDFQRAAKTLLKKDKKLCNEAAAVMQEILNLIR